MYRMEVSSGVSSSKNIIPMSSENPRHWLIRFVIGCGQFWLVPRTGAEKNDLDTQRNKAGVLRSESAAGKKQKATCRSSRSVGSCTGADKEIAGFLLDPTGWLSWPWPVPGKWTASVGTSVGCSATAVGALF